MNELARRIARRRAPASWSFLTGLAGPQRQVDGVVCAGSDFKPEVTQISAVPVTRTIPFHSGTTRAREAGFVMWPAIRLAC